MATIDLDDNPLWLREGHDGAPTDDLLNKRTQSRYGWLISTCAKLLSSPDTVLRSVKTYNVSRGGLGLITRLELREGDQLELSPMDGVGEPVPVRVVHSRQTIQGFKVGCEFVTD